MSMQRLPPQNIEAEVAIVGAGFLSQLSFAIVLEQMEMSDFHRGSHRKIYQVMLDLIERGEAVDLLTVRAELECRKQIDDVGGPAYLASLVDDVPTAANVEFHAKLVHEKAIARNLLNASVEMATKCYEGARLGSELLEEAQDVIFGLSSGQKKTGLVSNRITAKEWFDDLEKLSERDGQLSGIPSGLQDLDGLTCGFQKKDLILIAARPGMGKSALAACNIAVHAASKGFNIAFFSMEMDKKQVVGRQTCAIGKVSTSEARTGKFSDPDAWEKLAWANEIVGSLPISIDDTAEQTVVEVKSKCKRMLIQTGLDLIVVDYLQLMKTHQQHANKNDEVGNIAQSLKNMAMELDVPVIAMSQLNRKCEERPDKRPMLSDLRDSGNLEQASDIVICVYRPEEYFEEAERGLAELIIAKYRNGPKGTVLCRFLGEFTCFANYTQRQEDRAFG